GSASGYIVHLALRRWRSRSSGISVSSWFKDAMAEGQESHRISASPRPGRGCPDPMPKLLATLSLIVALAALAAACGGGSDSTAVSADSSCPPGELETVANGVLTVATDKPAYPPYFEDDDPTNGEGFESAVAYAIGKQLGYPKAKLKWTV